MANPTSRILPHLRQLLVDPLAEAAPDHELLQRFVEDRQEAAFETILHRHGPMVLAVCRSMLACQADVEDVFQATFLVLVRKARALRRSEALPSWLNGIAYRVALKARALAARRRECEAEVPPREATDKEELGWAEVQLILHEELCRLSERYRAPLTLCYLGGKTQDEVASILGLSKGTLKRRLERGRAILRERLVRRGLGPMAGLLGAAWPYTAVTSSIPSGLSRATLSVAFDIAAGRTTTVSPTVATLIQGGMQSMVTKHVWWAAGVLCGLATLAGMAAGMKPTSPQPNPPPPMEEAKKPTADPRLTFDEKLAREMKFVVVGRVLSADGKTPLEGVEVTASAGLGTLRPTGVTKTDRDGRFRLIFGQGIWRADGKVAHQVAIIHARKPGMHAWTYGWRAEFYLSDRALEAKDVPPKYTNLVPGTPAPLEFRMQPAAALRVKVLDGSGQPLVNTRLQLTGKNLPPGASVIASGRTDANGSFTADDVPRSQYRLVIEDVPGGRGSLELGSIRFQDAAEYAAVATIHAWGPKETHVTFKVTRGRAR